jgi:uncharacterized protein (TIGR03437 family)
VPAITASPGALAFTIQAGSTIRPGDQSITLTAPAPTSFSAAASTFSGGNWLTITSAAAGTTPAIVTAGVTNFSTLAAGPYTGLITVTSPASLTPVQIPVTLTVTGAPALLVDPRSVVFTHATPAVERRIIALSTTGGSLRFTAASNTPWLTVVPSTGETPGMPLEIAVNSAGFAPGTYTGTITITAPGSPNSPQTVAITLNVPAPEPSVTAVTNAATFARGPVSPGELITIFGANLGPEQAAGLRLTAAGLVDTVLGDTRVLFDGVPTPLVYVSSRQISAIVPYAIAGNPGTQLQVEYKGARSIPVDLRVVAAAPGIFPRAIFNQDGSPNTAQNPAALGSIVVFYATGEGQTDPPGIDGKPASDLLPKPRLPVSVKIGGVPADIVYAGAAPNQPAGVIQVNARVPLGFPFAEGLPLVLTIGDAGSQAETVFVRP